MSNFAGGYVMKKLLSLIMSIIISLSCISVSGTAYAEELPHIEDAILSLETQTGYIPWQNSSVQGNCFAFISDVCAKLYGVTYYYEQMVGNYQFNHTNNYFTVAETAFPYNSSLDVQLTYALQLRDWLLDNAAVGDILQYGSASPSYSKKHTVIIQHIDTEKLQVLHSNYETQNVSASVCRVDTIYWNSFLSNLNNVYDDSGNIISINYLFGSQFKLAQGFGLSLNRYSNIESKYILDSARSIDCKITKTERASTTSVKLTWNSVRGATAYSIDYRLNYDLNWINASYAITDTSFTVENLQVGQTYLFRVSAFVDGMWKTSPEEVSKEVLPPKPANITVSSDFYGITIKWAKRSDITGVVIYRSENKSDGYYPIATISDNNCVSYTDNAVGANKTYYYKIQRYILINGQAFYSEISSAKSGMLKLEAPTGVSLTASGKNSLNLKWNSVLNAEYYVIYYQQKGKSDSKSISTTSTSITLKGLTTGKVYNVCVYSVNGFGISPVSKTVGCTVKPKTPIITVSKSGGKAKLSWKKQENVSGYVIYRAYSKNGKYKAVKTIKGNKTFTYKDKNTYKGNKYYYKVKSYVKVNGKNCYSNASSVKSVKIS